MKDNELVRLTETVHGAGCACKIGPGDLHEALRDMPAISDANLIAGMEHGEDAGVYKLRDDLAIIQTVDFFTPIVDDPFIFGQIAVTNALSDVYAMGGIPLTALNIVCFPVNTMDMNILRDILRGGLDKMREAGVLLIGGHSIEDKELKYGISVTGTVHPDHVLLNRGAVAGDRLVLTKSLGTGIVSTALKGGLADKALVAKAIASMTTLNKKAAELLAGTPGVHACTDITGFGLIGHAAEMIEGTDVGMMIQSASVPFFPEIRDFIETGIVPGGLHRNRSFRNAMLDIHPDCPGWLVDVFFDPQTAGGLLVSIDGKHADGLVRDMHACGIEDAAIIGEIIEEPKGKILLR
jgi:selenide,water dikinase